MTPGVLDERPFLWSNGALRELELPAGFDFSEAYAIADNGEVGAEAFTPVPSWVSVHGILWTRDGVHDVNDLTDTHDWLVTTILAMTRDGDVIAGALDRNVQPHAVVLIRGAPAVPDK